MGRVKFIFALHNHQPVGNFDHIFRDAFNMSYRPFIDVLERHPGIKAVLHYTGPLLDWIAANEPDFLKRVEKSAAAGQIEILSGGYYEPLLTLIPEDDAVGQMKKMNDFIENNFSVKPNGFWLTERVWEPTFPTIAKKAGLFYTALDDSHLQYAGIVRDKIRDYYVTENNGNILNIFPISKYLRYAIPFKSHDEVINHMKSFLGDEDVIITLADDGEKFGVWPGTYKWVYEEGWLETFFRRLEECSDWLDTVTFSEALRIKKPAGMVYIPTASYEEMMEWALPPDSGVRYEELKKKIKESGLYDLASDFLRGGFFRNFFVKYTESAAMKNKQFYVSSKVHAMSDEYWKKTAIDALWQGECNCPYWHGVFGGLYLHHLRRSTYSCLIRAENIADNDNIKPRIVMKDINFDGSDEILFESKKMSFYVYPHLGGIIGEWDDRENEFNVLDTMTRRPETYHYAILHRNHLSCTGGENASIHDLNRKVSEDIVKNLVYDKYDRRSLIDIAVPDDITFDNYIRSEYSEIAILYGTEYSAEVNNGDLSIELGATFKIEGGVAEIVKKIIPDKNNKKITVKYAIINLADKRVSFRFISEWNFNFKSKNKVDTGVTKKIVCDEWSDRAIAVRSCVPVDFWQYEINTVSQTESSYSLSSQGTSLAVSVNLDIPTGKKEEFSYELSIIDKPM